ncbi:MAG TPA: isoprenylcysteine carboxylmethyltransferase family protein [Candidatus Anaerobiospirillum stercoravium]|nr:isoprenylcysteine carboxylmethyltransferase family protein [Candidatus Anaerobiospirillum stercoravium]
MQFTLKDKLLTVLGFIIFLVVGPALMVYLSRLDPTTFLDQEDTTLYLAGLMSAVGLGLALWANYTLIVQGKGGAGNFGPIKLMTETRHLVRTGPYSICRNPMHLGVFFYYAGFACALNSLVALVVPLAFIVFAYFNAIVLDEPRLKRDFPEEWSIYEQEVPRFLPRALKRRRS